MMVLTNPHVKFRIEFIIMKIFMKIVKICPKSPRFTVLKISYEVEYSLILPYILKSPAAVHNPAYPISEFGISQRTMGRDNISEVIRDKDRINKNIPGLGLQKKTPNWRMRKWNTELAYSEWVDPTLTLDSVLVQF